MDQQILGMLGGPASARWSRRSGNSWKSPAEGACNTNAAQGATHPAVLGLTQGRTEVSLGCTDGDPRSRRAAATGWRAPRRRRLVHRSVGAGADVSRVAAPRSGPARGWRPSMGDRVRLGRRRPASRRRPRAAGGRLAGGRRAGGVVHGRSSSVGGRRWCRLPPTSRRGRSSTRRRRWRSGRDVRRTRPRSIVSTPSPRPATSPGSRRVRGGRHRRAAPPVRGAEGQIASGGRAAFDARACHRRVAQLACDVRVDGLPGPDRSRGRRRGCSS